MREADRHKKTGRKRPASGSPPTASAARVKQEHVGREEEEEEELSVVMAAAEAKWRAACESTKKRGVQGFRHLAT